jgi:hypothetical protein
LKDAYVIYDKCRYFDQGGTLFPNKSISVTEIKDLCPLQGRTLLFANSKSVVCHGRIPGIEMSGGGKRGVAGETAKAYGCGFSVLLAG